MSIDDLRRKIDTIDDAIVDLLQDRAEAAEAIGRAKAESSTNIHDPERERHLLDRLERRAVARGGAFPAQALRSVYREVLSACLSRQGALEVAYLGPAGTFTHMAAQRRFGLAARYLECATIAGVFDAVERGHARYGVVPVENSTEGGVTFTLDELFVRPLRVWGEVVSDISHCLVSNATELGNVKIVHSHPQALAQCRGWLARNLPNAQLSGATSTAAAARAAREDDGSAAIASELGAELAGLAVLRRNIQDRAQNVTRFAVLSESEQAASGDDKTSIVFSLRHERGALRQALTHLEDAGLNLTRIESRPHPERLWEYVFFTDFEGHHQDPSVVTALAALETAVGSLKVLGSYPRSPLPNQP
ncbi:MAG: prephenate dehydratase [Polyangiaceae bacterium]